MKGTDNLEDMRVDEGIILKWTLKWVVVTTGGSCERG